MAGSMSCRSSEWPLGHTRRQVPHRVLRGQVLSRHAHAPSEGKRPTPAAHSVCLDQMWALSPREATPWEGQGPVKSWCKEMSRSLARDRQPEASERRPVEEK